MPEEGHRLPQVSVVLPTFDRPELLERAVKSVVSQTFTDWELLVIDDNAPSSDARRLTMACMERFDSDPRIRYVPLGANGGAPAARNVGIRKARADTIAFLDDDDAWLPEKLARQFAVLERSGDEVGAVFVGYRRVFSADHPDETVVPPADSGELVRLLERNRIGTTSSVACRREALVAIGCFDEALPASQDYDLYLRLATRYEFERVPEVLLLSFRHGLGSISDDPLRKRRAFDMFYEKHRNLFESHPRSHARHLAWMGQRMLRLGFVEDAERYLRRSLGLVRIAPGNWALLALCRLDEKARNRLWHLRRAAMRSLVRRR